MKVMILLLRPIEMLAIKFTLALLAMGHEE